MKIDGIEIKNYRSIRKLSLKNLDNINVFVGENSSGKSTVLNAIQLATSPLRLYSEQSYKDIYHNRVIASITLIYKLSDIFYDRLFRDLMLLQDSKTLKFINDYKGNSSKSTDTKVFRRMFKKFINEDFFKSKISLQKIAVKTEINSSTNLETRKITKTNGDIIEFYNDSLEALFIKSIINVPVVIKDERGFFNEATANGESISNSVFNVFINTLQNPEEHSNDIENKLAKDLNIYEINMLMNEKLVEHSNLFLERIQNIFNEYTDDYGVKWEFNDNLITPYDFNTAFTDKGDNSVNFMSIGSGTRSMYIISLLQAYFNMTIGNIGSGGIFLIEEPELYLYPKLEDKVANILYDLTAENQLFITTHSSNIVNRFSLEDIFAVESKFDREGSYSEFGKLDSKNAISEIFGFNIYPFFEKDYVIFVEGSKDVRYYKKIYELLFGDNVEKIAFIQTGGVDKIFYGLSCQFIASTSLAYKFLICCDADHHKDEGIEGILKEEVCRVADIKNNHKNHYYFTEESTNLETLFLPYKVMCEKFPDNFDDYVYRFISDNGAVIKESFIEKSNKKWTDNIEIFLDNYLEKSAEDNYMFMRKYVFSKNVFKKFKEGLDNPNIISRMQNIDNFDKELIKNTAPKLIEKLTYINKIIDV